MCELIPQTHARTCGHACVAMISGKTEKEIIELIGHSKGTKTKEIVSALNKLNIKNSEKLLRICQKNPLPETGIIKAIPEWRERSSGSWHWILKYKSEFLDPWSGERMKHFKFVSFIEIHSV